MKPTPKPLLKNLCIYPSAGALVAVLVALLAPNSALAYNRYNDPDGGCAPCHGKFTDNKSTKTPATVFPTGGKHGMHRNNTAMNTDCRLCHSGGDGNNPFIGSSDGIGVVQGLGCTGCHEASGLRAHHIKNQVGVNCYDCHDPAAPPAEGVNPPYYGTAYTKANNSCNDKLASNTNENWSIGDFLGLDNDGDNLYDQADFDCGPPYRLISAVPEGANVRITWETVGGRVDAVQASSSVGGSYSDLSGAISIPGVGPVVTNFLEAGGDGNAERFYRIRYVP